LGVGCGEKREISFLVAIRNEPVLCFLQLTGISIRAGVAISKRFPGGFVPNGTGWESKAGYWVWRLGFQCA
jgi:hypothetical protein